MKEDLIWRKLFFKQFIILYLFFRIFANDYINRKKLRLKNYEMCKFLKYFLSSKDYTHRQYIEIEYIFNSTNISYKQRKQNSGTQEAI